MSGREREIIGRATMALVAIVLAWIATALLRFSIHLITERDQIAPLVEALGRLTFLVAGSFIALVVLLYITAIWLLCFVFSSMDKRKTRPGQAMGWANRIESFFESFFRILLRLT